MHEHETSFRKPAAAIASIARRQALGIIAAAAALPFLGHSAQALARVGAVEVIRGNAFARLSDVRRLSRNNNILLGDLVWTEKQSRMTVRLDLGARLYLGPKARLVVDRYIAGTSGDLTLGEGAMVFDRDDDLPKIDLEVRTKFGLIAVRGTRFFAGPSKGVFGVFCQRGRVRVVANGVAATLDAGEGVDIPRRGAPPSAVTPWGQARIDQAFASVLA